MQTNSVYAHSKEPVQSNLLFKTNSKILAQMWFRKVQASVCAKVQHY